MTGKKKITGSLEVSGSIVSIEEPLVIKTKNILWADLVALRDAGELIPGQQYRITDYMTTTTQANTQSAGHQFDIIVTADDVDKLNENARACLHEGDTYFANSKLEAWKLKYCLDNDTSRFAWADARHLQFDNNTYFLSSRVVTIGSFDYHLWVSTDVYGYKTYLGTLSTSLQTGDSLYYIILEGEDDWYIEDSYDFEGSMLSVGGKGVIYQMIDEFNNDVPYDFKNIQFKRKLTDGELDLDGGIDTWVYTFTISDLIADKVVDISLKQNTEYMEGEGQYKECANNVIKEAILEYQPDGLIRVQLNDNVFLNIFDGDYGNYYGCYGNTLGNNCTESTFGNSCYSNTFGNNCYFNTFGDNCFNNTFGNGCYYNTFGGSFYSNTFGKGCHSNTFGDSCHSNTFGSSCYSNAFGDSCQYNTFGKGCHSNTFGEGCIFNAFGDGCYSNTFGERCNFNTFGNNCIYLQISDLSQTFKKYISVDSGVRGASSANKFDLYDPAILDKNYQVTFKKSASGKYLMLWATDTGTMTGKVKDSNIDTTWEDIV